MPLPLAIPLAMTAVGVGAKGYNMFQANKREKEALKQLDQLRNTPYARYSVNPLVRRYTELGLRDFQQPQGFTGAETAAFRQQLAAQNAALAANAMSAGGGSVGRAVTGLNNINTINALNQFAGQGAALARSARNLGMSRYMQGAGVAQGIDNMNIQNELNRRMMLEQALGAAARQNRDIVSRGIEGIGSDLMGAGMYLGANELYTNPNASFFGGGGKKLPDENALAAFGSSVGTVGNQSKAASALGMAGRAIGRNRAGGMNFANVNTGTGSPVDLRGTTPDFGERNDGTKKGMGYFGGLKTKGGDVATEMSIGVELDGKETEIPTLIPTLSDQEKNWLLQGNDVLDRNNPMAKRIVDKAIRFARLRKSQGLSPFAD